MAHLYRLIALTALLFACAFANAAFPPLDITETAECNPVKYPGPNLTGSTWNGQPQTKQWVCKKQTLSNGTTNLDCGWNILPNNYYMGQCNIWGEIAKCPDGSTKQPDGNCSCNAPLLEVNGKCVPSDPNKFCQDENTLYNRVGEDRWLTVDGNVSGGKTPRVVCRELDAHPKGPGWGCKVLWTPELSFTARYGDKVETGTGGQAWGVFPGEPGVGSDLNCRGDKQPPPPGGSSDPAPIIEATKPDPACKGHKGTVNGVEVCIASASGTTEGVDWQRVNGSDGTSTDIRTTVRCDRDNCKVTQDRTTRDSAGNPTGTTTTVTENIPRDSYCAQNPTSAVCRFDRDRTGENKPGNSHGNAPGSGSSGGGGSGGGGSGSGGNGNGDGDKESSFGGACGGGFQCEGDAIQCAIAKEQHKRACELFVNTTPQSDLFNREKDKEGNQTENLPGNQTFDLANRISSADALGVAASGLKDLQVSVWNHAVTLPLSGLNPYLAILGNVLVAVSFLIAARIIGRG